jgi:arylsulfatase B
MGTRIVRCGAMACGWLLVAMAASALAAVPQRPNFVIFLADDQGWNDVGYHGSQVQTPVLDELARTGVRLERHYVYPTCSPTRACLLTGRNASRFGIAGPIGGRSEQALPRDTVTLATALRRVGYDTAICGKWHLGLRPEVGPKQYGFQHTYGYLHGQLDQYKHDYKNGDRTWHRNDEFVDEPGHVTDLLAAEAVAFIEKPRNGPFFLYVPFSVPHYPVQEEAQWLAPYEGKIADRSRRAYAASITHMDAAIGRVLAALDRTAQRQRTLVVFSSDNGGQKSWGAPSSEYGGRFEPHPVLGNNEPLRGWKGQLYEGGIRVPALAHWPGVLQPREVHAAVHIIDWFPTFARLAGCETPPHWNLEGTDIWPLLAGGEPTGPRTFYWKVPGQWGLMHGDWKLIVPARGEAAVELYDLSTDPREQVNRAAQEPQRVGQLRELLAQQQALD